MSELIVVVGPCGAGKTTWARATYPRHAHPDAEELARTLFADRTLFRYYPWTRAVSRRLLITAVDDLAARGVPTVVTARGAKAVERRVWLGVARRHQIPAHVVRMLTPADACVERARADPLRPPSSRSAWERIVEAWFRDWQPPTADEGHASYREISVSTDRGQRTNLLSQVRGP